MAFPLSKKQLSHLGDRLIAESSPPSDVDRKIFQEYLNYCDQIQVSAAAGLRSLLETRGLTVTGRTKTTGTIQDKLRREHGIKLPYIRDVAGVRAVGALNLLEQDEIAALVQSRFNLSNGAELVDRRLSPTAGYRAVHVLLRVDGLPVEVQLRTELQALWAELYERQADLWGRGLRYGEGPRPDSAGRTGPRAEFITSLVEVSGLIAQFEEGVARGIRAEAKRREIDDELRGELVKAKQARGQEALMRQTHLRAARSHWEGAKAGLDTARADLEANVRWGLKSLADIAPSID